MNKVSVIVPVYNGEKDIERCLFSLLNQTISVDIIVVNDGSTDDTEKVIRKIEQLYPEKIKYYFKENKGIASARNFGVNQVKTEYFGFLDSDDFTEKNMFESLLNKIEDTNSDICMSNFVWLYEDGTKHITKDINYKNKHDILNNMFAVLWNKLYRTEWFKNTGITFPDGLKYEDASVLYRLALNMDKVCYVDDVFVNYVQKTGSITRTFNVEINDMIEVFKGIKQYYIHQNQYEEYKNEIEYLYIRFFLGNSYLRACRIKDRELRNSVLNKGWNFLNDNYPNFKDNCYLKNSGLKNKYFSMINKKTYFINVYLFKLLYVLGIMK